MGSDQPHSRTRLSATEEQRIDAICDRFEAAWKAERRPRIKEHINNWSDPELSSLLHELLVIDLAYRLKRGEAPSRAEYEAIFPQHTQVIASAFAEEETSPSGIRGSFTAGRQRPPNTSPSDAAEEQPTPLSDEVKPTQIDRYRILELLGKGGFGTVYLGYDDQLRRKVAIKVPRNDRVAEHESFLTEAQILASLDHPNIVDVYDAGQTSDGSFYIVSKWMEGADLSRVAEDRQLTYPESAELVAKIADALQYAHGRKLVHRDIKPANILIDATGEPYLSDFGLALSEDAFGREGAAGGTAAYMSPEQARGEGHLVDGRSDIFSLGAVFYRLLTGERPFQGASPDEVLERIRTQEARPPRQLVADIPKELERICLNALCRQAKNRYTTALDMASDLQHFLRPDATRTTEPAAEVVRAPQAQQRPTPTPKVVPKGLRSFDRVDADFFLQLLPGPVDRDGLPEAIRFWKTRIEETEADDTFRVGLIYGPSGCGKSSLIKAGLLPRLAGHVESIYLECNGSDDEQRLLRGLRRRFGGLELGLSETLAAIRRGRAMPSAHKILIVLDQFEQWLHAHRETESARLIDALRQCDGERVQCVIMARDDFWMAVTSFMRQLDEPILEGRNSAAVHLFDPLHARNVLAKFGRSFGRLPVESAELSSDQIIFLDQAISDLTRDGKVIPVRLTLFADMVKGKAWMPLTLKQYGGAGGVTITFLEESFSATTAPPGRRLHERSARSVLRALLPETGTNMKGHKRSHTQLLEASGYRERPQQFDDLMRTLDNETRLLTPIEPALATERAQQPLQTETSERYYQLTHDYLVQPLREWLTSKQRETRRGRSELMLAERSNLWNARPESKQLPSLWEWLRILLLVSRVRWTMPQANMMRAASRLRLRRLFSFVLLVAFVGAFVWLSTVGIIRIQVAQARQAWHEGREEDAISWLPDRNHRAVHQLRLEMLNEGGVTFHTRPEDLEVEVRPDPETDRKLELNCSPQVISEGNPRFRSGDHIRLTVGHYRVLVYRNFPEILAEFPLFIDWSTYDRIKRDRQWSPHRTRMPLNRRSNEDLSTLELAEQVRLVIDIPNDIPDGFVYVNPGPMWRGRDPKTVYSGDVRRIEDPSAKGESSVEVKAHDGSDENSLVRDHISHGFLIARAETTVEDLQRWWDLLGSQYCDWRTKIYSRIPEAVAETKSVPLSVQQECWRAELDRAESDATHLTKKELLELALKDVDATAADIWEKYNETTTIALGNALNDLPVTVNWETAIAYARTHAPIEPAEFRRWVVKMIRNATDYAARLENLHGAIEATKGAFVDPSSLPDTPLVRDLLSPVEAQEYRRPVLDAYCYWLKIRTYYAWQVPIERVLDVTPAAEVKLEPTTWLWKKGSRLTIRDAEHWPPRDLVDSYADAIAYDKEQLSREHFLLWLGWMIEQEKVELQTYQELLGRLDQSMDDTLKELAFAIRYRYGMHLGWDIPTWKEWEKAYRGADARAYTWGNDASYEQARLHCWKDGMGPLSEVGAETPLNDKSPYRVRHMAGNLSEWVRVSDNPLKRMSPEGGTNGMVPDDSNTVHNATFPQTVYLKGGNYVLEAHFANAGHSLSLPGFLFYAAANEQTNWSGFRVIRRIGETTYTE